MRRPKLGYGLAAALLASTALAAGSPAVMAEETTPPVAAEPATVQAEQTLSDESALSHWAFVNRRVIARREPSDDARAVKRLTTRTPDRTSELVLVLRERTFTDGAVWAEVRLPMRPNNTTGWVPRGALSAYHKVVDRLVINRRTKRATFYRNGRAIWRARVGVGQRRWPTPAGRFYVRDRLIPNNSRGPYGPFAFGLSAYSSKLTDWPGGGMIGIHGTNQPGLIPGRISHGCIRVRNGKIKRLRGLMGPGTPVRIL